MKVLVIGSGAREHALCWRLKQSSMVTEVLCAPGNPGIAQVATCLPIAVTAVKELLAAAKDHGVSLTVVGPEAALAAGVVDIFEGAGIAIVGPNRRAAMLESSKSFAKEIMIEANVPTARYEVFSSSSTLREYCSLKGAPLVLKADGLASGKGVFVITDDSQFDDAIESLFGPLGAKKVVAEEFLKGFEVSCIFAANGSEVIPLAPAHDYKRLSDGDAGPNTGGMGSVCPTPRINADDLNWIQNHCAQPIVDVMKKREGCFKGFLYAGLMIDPTLPREQGVRVLEYNTRLGDPECQSILARLDSDPVDLFAWISGSTEIKPFLKWNSKIATCVVVASDGYPENPVKGDSITGLELVSLVPQTMVFQAATRLSPNGELISDGGRTLSVVGLGNSLDESRGAAYKAVDMIQLRGRRIRRDIGL